VPWCSLSLILFFHAPFAREKSEYKSISSFFFVFYKVPVIITVTLFTPPHH
jgi:hypothetical protein